MKTTVLGSLGGGGNGLPGGRGLHDMLEEESCPSCSCVYRDRLVLRVAISLTPWLSLDPIESFREASAAMNAAFSSCRGILRANNASTMAWASTPREGFDGIPCSGRRPAVVGNAP